MSVCNDKRKTFSKQVETKKKDTFTKHTHTQDAEQSREKKKAEVNCLDKHQAVFLI